MAQTLSHKEPAGTKHQPETRRQSHVGGTQRLAGTPDVRSLFVQAPNSLPDVCKSLASWHGTKNWPLINQKLNTKRTSASCTLQRSPQPMHAALLHPHASVSLHTEVPSAREKKGFAAGAAAYYIPPDPLLTPRTSLLTPQQSHTAQGLR